MYARSYRGSGKKVFWQEMWRHEFMDALQRDPVVIVPVGSVEQHGPHSPMDVDISGPFYLAIAVAERVNDFPVIVAPPVWAGLAHYNMGFPGTISLRSQTLQMLLTDVIKSIHANGFERIVCLNGHGGNSAPSRAVCWELAQDDIFSLHFNWWDMVTEELRAWGQSDLDVGHGGEWETSVQLHLRAHLIDSSRAGKDKPGTQPFSAELGFAEFAERRRDTAQCTGTMGDAQAASADKGRRIFELASDRLEKLVREYHALPVRHYKEFGSHCP
jgi:creatinine amidohydrolase